MIAYVDMAHPLLLDDPARREAHLAQRQAVARRLQAIAGVPCRYRHYLEVDPAFVRRHGVRALVLSGVASHWRRYDWRTFDGLAEVLRVGDTPILGVCGGALILGRLLGAPVARLGRLAPGEADPAAYMPGWRKEWGYLPVDVVAPDPLFAGLGPRPVLRQAHGRHLAAVPPGCALLASSPACRVQAFRRAGTPVYGVQFHPEAYTDAFPAGRQLLANFFALALASGVSDRGTQ
jgi:GMP synthase-like glutamine amidotransferase